MGYLFGQKRRKVSRLQRQAARCFLVTQEASSVELGTWCWPRVVLIEKRPLTECERSSMNRAARSVGACQSRQRPSAAFCRASSLGHRISGESQGQSDFALVTFLPFACSVATSAPGQKMQDKGSVRGQPGASGYAPGQRMQDKGSKPGQPGASGYAPGHQDSTSGQGSRSGGTNPGTSKSR
jgi:hypothetical protein